MCHMNKLYYNQNFIASKLITFFSIISLNLSKPNLKMLAFSIISLINSESVVTADLANSINSNQFSSNSDSIQKRFWRFFNNKNINIYDTYNSIINYIISNINNVRHNELIVSMDHMFIKDNFVILMFSLKIDNQGIPLWFSLERTSSNCHSNIQKNSRKKLFSQDFIFNAIDSVINLLKPLNSKIIFLADRWFFNLQLLKHIEDNNCFFAFRAKVNSCVKVLVYDKKEKHYIYRKLSYFKPYAFKSAFFESLSFGDMGFIANLAIAPASKTKDSDSNIIDDDNDTWFIITNLKPKLAIRKYKMRYASIEFLFKAQKSNGFFLEKTKTKNLHAMETLYGVVCIAHLWLSILGLDYIKNYNHIKNKINIRFNKKVNGKTIRILSTFKLGLTLFKRVYNHHIDFILKTNFRLYL